MTSLSVRQNPGPKDNRCRAPSLPTAADPSSKMNTTRTFPDQADYLGPDEQVLRCVIAYNRHGG